MLSLVKNKRFTDGTLHWAGPVDDGSRNCIIPGPGWVHRTAPHGQQGPDWGPVIFRGLDRIA